MLDGRNIISQAVFFGNGHDPVGRRDQIDTVDGPDGIFDRKRRPVGIDSDTVFHHSDDGTGFGFTGRQNDGYLVSDRDGRCLIQRHDTA